MKTATRIGDDGATADTGRGFFGSGSFAVPKTKLLKVSAVKESPHNPKRRVDPKRLRPLVKSMAEVGLLYDILVDSRNTVIDGHRRLAAARELGWEFISAKVIPDGQDSDSLYASVNVTAARTTGNDALCVWLENPRAVTSRQAVVFAEMEASLGRAMVEDVAARGWSASIWDIAGRVARYTAHQENDDLKQIVRWFMNAAVMQQVREALRTGIPAKQLWNAVRDMKPLRFVSQSD